jgi:hypothetical protein
MLKDNQLTVIIFAVFVAVALIYYIYPGEAVFYGSHTMYETENSTAYGYAEFCLECHDTIVRDISGSGAHNNTACICHGYNPNATSTMRNVNLAHNLTKNAYCTNCHTRYDENTGELNVTGGDGAVINVQNQSAHYIYYNASNASSIEEIYNRTWKYFNRSFGPLPE